MKKEQYLEIYDFIIPFSDGMIAFYNKKEVKLEQGGVIIAKGKVDDLRFSEDGELRITNPDESTDYLAFDMLINGEWYGPFNSKIKTPPENDSDLEYWKKNIK